jgi:AraC family transcriptional regulator
MKAEHYARKLSRLRKVANHIDAHLAQALSLHDLAEIANMSRYHFDRVFNDYAGETPLARVRRLRLALARQKLEAGPSSSILNLAMEYGYTSAEAFSRAFKASHGQAPSEIRPRTADLRPVQITSLPALAIQYIPFVGTLDDSIQPFDELRARALLAEIPRERRKGWCVELAGDMGDATSHVELQVGLLSELIGLRIPGLSMGELPSGDYAVIQLLGSYAPPSAEALAERIENETGRKVANAPILRCFQNASYLPAQFEKRCDLYIPVKT